MIRKQIVIEPEQERLLTDLAGQLGVSQSEVVRMAIEAFAGEVRSEEERERAFEELMVMFKNSTFEMPVDEHGNRAWLREELYERGTR
jgi:hypothetical protein